MVGRKKERKPVAADLIENRRGRQFRDRITRVIGPSIKGSNTNAKQWGRWTP